MSYKLVFYDGPLAGERIDATADEYNTLTVFNHGVGETAVRYVMIQKTETTLCFSTLKNKQRNRRTTKLGG